MSKAPLFVAEGADAPKQDLPFVEREAITALVYDPKTDIYLGLRWKQVDWETLVTGGVEENQTAEEAARAEIVQETGYKNLRLIAELPPYDAKFYHQPEGVNRFAHMRCFFFELAGDERSAVAPEELAKHEIVWLLPEELAVFCLPEGHRFVVDCAIN